jgi:hypothetical protein
LQQRLQQFEAAFRQKRQGQPPAGQ